jgi:hypothetical protein
MTDLNNTMQLVAALSDRAKARDLALALGGTLFADQRPGAVNPDLPFAALVTCATDNLPALIAAADIGVYLACERKFKVRKHVTAGEQAGVVGIFAMVANPDLGARGADDHWRDVHAPLALQVHEAMTHYRQLSVLHCFHGPDWHGFALCGFDSLVDLREHFFATPDGRAAIMADIAILADVKKSPRRVIATETLR